MLGVSSNRNNIDEFPERFFDTGICESHLMAMAAGMAKSGMRPFTAIYSTLIWFRGRKDRTLHTGRGKV